MTKRQQLEWIHRLRLPTPRFSAVQYEDFQQGIIDARKLRFPVAVRSSYVQEDGELESHAGQFTTVLDVAQEELHDALEAVFKSYPQSEGSEALIQEMVDPDYSGVLFAFREGAWKVELIEGQGEALVSGHRKPESLLLPRFSRADAWLFPLLRFWKGLPGRPAALNNALVWLSYYAGLLLDRMDAEHGLDIEFCITNGRLLLLQARPITTPEEAEEVLTSANHKEILPPEPSPLMTTIIESSGYQLFEYYQSLDLSLPPRAFVREAAGMPWINLSALLDVMVHWGLPSSLVCRSVGAEDFYRVGFRLHRALRKLPVFLKMARQQSGKAKRIEKWVYRIAGRFDWRRRHRELLWENAPAAAFLEWETDFRQLYVELVTNMQALTGAMSGPIGLFEHLGLLAKLSATLKQKSASADYLQAFQELQYGMISRQEFLECFGHRGFYESDIGQKRFFEYSEAEWQQLIGDYSFSDPTERRQQAGANAFWTALFRPVARLIHTREWLRNETMKLFWDFRRELLSQTDFPFQEHSPEELLAYFNGGIREKTAPKPSGWDMDTFLCNRNGRRLPLSILSNIEEQDGRRQGIGIYPGLVEGQVWRVSSARFEALEIPKFEKIILVADALDPGWAPFFSQVDGVISYVGGLLSHASILLRESHIPAITQLPAQIELRTGDWVEMDGQTGEVRVLAGPV